MKDVSSLDAIECIAGLVLQLLRCPCGTQEHAVEATVSVGIAMSDGQTPRTFNDLYDNACTALLDAKRAKDHRFVIYDCNGKPARGQYGFDRLVNASTPNYQPFLDTLANGGVLLRAEPKGSFVPQYFSDSFLALLGGMAREEALSVYGDDMVAGMHPDDRQRMRDEIKESLSAETPLRTIARMRKAGGGYVWVSIFAVWTRENVLRMISEGTFQLTKEFRREDAGRIRWTSLVAHIVENPLNRHMIAFVYIADIERRHVEVAFASVFARPNATTGLYSKESLERIAAAIQQADTPEEPLAAVAVIRVAMPADLRAMLSAEDSSSGQVFLGQQLSVCLAQEGLVARYGADGFLVLFLRVDSEAWLRQRIETSIADLRKAYVDKDGNAHPIVLACGHAIEEVSEMRFNDAVARAKSACRVNEAEPTGSLWSFDERIGQMRRAMKPGSGRSMRTVSAEEMNRPLTGAERAALDAAMHAMIMANNYDEAITNVLGVLGQAYHAHRVFTVALLENGMVAGLHEWHEPGAPPIIGQLMGRPLKEYGTLQNSANAGMPVLVERVHAKRRNASDEGARLWRFIAFPVMKYGMCAGFLCVEDPYINSTDVALINSLMPMITRMRDREGGISTTSITRLRDKLTGLPGRTMFERNAITFDSSLFHSVAVLRVGLERIYTLEGDRDTENENKLLLYAARNLTGLFPLDSTYRTDELQLTCVVTNMSYDAFNARTTRMAAIMRQRMRNGFALCDAWSDAMPSLSKLLEEAGTSVYGDRSIFFPDERSHAFSTMPSFQRAFDGDAFSVRLQPQVDLKTGEVVGSEALARCLTPSGETIPPSEFIPRMEAEGNVFGLDYFVFEKVLATLNDWTDRGLKPLPVAVNFSRQTVLDPSFVASILALTSRYDVPEDLLEIEITESMGAFKNMELRGAMETLRGQGFRFALDDLGSEYSTLSAMSDLPFDTVKLDRLLVKRFTDDSMSRSIVEGIARACEKNGIRCVAEGVEFASYIEPLVSMGCHYGQGYCFARPMTIDQFTNEYLVDANEDAERTIPIPKGDGEE